MTVPESAEPSYSLTPDPGEVDVPTTDPATHEHSDLREFLVLLRRHTLLIAFVAIATAGVAFLLSVRMAKQYTAGTTLLYSATSTTTGTDADPTRAIATIVGIAQSNTVLAPIAAQYKLSMRSLKNSVNVTDDTTSDLLKITATSGSPAKAALLANSIAQSLIASRLAQLKALLQAQVGALQQQLQTFAGKVDPSSLAAASAVRAQLAEARAQLTVSNPDLSVLTSAVTPAGPSSPHPTRNAAIGLVVGLVLGILLGALRDRLDRRTRAIDEVEAVYRAPMLGMVPFTKKRAPRAELLADFSGSGLLADAYRTIRTNLSLFRLNNSDSTIVVITSAVAGEGKSAVAANLAHALSVTGKNVLVVSADLHNPTLHEYFGLSATDAPAPAPLQRIDTTRAARTTPSKTASGLVQVLAGDVTLSEAVRIIPLTQRERSSGGSLALLANSSTFFDPAALFSSGQMNRFLQQAKQKYNVIVLDTPPLLVNADAALLAQSADVLVMVARLNHLTRNQARRAVRVMSATRIAPTGIIVTGDMDEPSYGYGYRYASEKFETEEARGVGTRVEKPRSGRL
jgi:Mrp family chromosome partitioning ATPase/capsular polysaccharide biosynthesis protein